MKSQLSNFVTDLLLQSGGSCHPRGFTHRGDGDAGARCDAHGEEESHRQEAAHRRNSGYVSHSTHTKKTPSFSTRFLIQRDRGTLMIPEIRHVVSLVAQFDPVTVRGKEQSVSISSGDFSWTMFVVVFVL